MNPFMDSQESTDLRQLIEDLRYEMRYLRAKDGTEAERIHDLSVRIYTSELKILDLEARLRAVERHQIPLRSFVAAKTRRMSELYREKPSPKLLYFCWHCARALYRRARRVS